MDGGGNRLLLDAKRSTADGAPEILVGELRQVLVRHGWEIIGTYVGPARELDLPPLDHTDMVGRGLDGIAQLLGEAALAARQLRAVVSPCPRVGMPPTVETSTTATPVQDGDAGHAELVSPPRSRHSGRPRKVIDRARVAALLAEGRSYKQIARDLRVGETTLRDALRRAASDSGG